MRPIKVKENATQKDLNFENLKFVDTNPFRDSLPVIHKATKRHKFNPLELLEQHGLEPKVFCVDTRKIPTPIFKVKSADWDWEVRPLEEEDVASVPTEFIKGLGVLKTHDFPVSQVAIAKPLPQESRGHVLGQEIANEAWLCFAMLFNVISLMVAGLVDILNDKKSESSDPELITPYRQNSTLLEDLKDPVLLVKIDKYFIEIGRWE